MRKVVVVDTSLVLKWIIHEPDSDKALALLAKGGNEKVEIHAPALLAYEATITPLLLNRTMIIHPLPNRTGLQLP